MEDRIGYVVYHTPRNRKSMSYSFLYPRLDNAWPRTDALCLLLKLSQTQDVVEDEFYMAYTVSLNIWIYILFRQEICMV